MRSILMDAAGVVLASVGHAVTLATSFVLNAQGQRVHCDVVNVEGSTMIVKAELVGPSGTPAASHSMSLGAGQGFGVTGQCINPGGTPPGCSAYYRFTAPRKSPIRGVLTITPGDSDSPIVNLPAQ
jgi:hypothetical protein